jgi:hypothetical protein
VWFWVATFLSPVKIESILYIEEYNTRFVNIRVGNDNTNYYLNNPVCIGA